MRIEIVSVEELGKRNYVEVGKGIYACPEEKRVLFFEKGNDQTCVMVTKE